MISVYAAATPNKFYTTPDLFFCKSPISLRTDNIIKCPFCPDHFLRVSINANWPSTLGLEDIKGRQHIINIGVHNIYHMGVSARHEFYSRLERFSITEAHLTIDF